MGRRALTAALGVVLAMGLSTWARGGEPKKERKPKPEPVSTADYIKAVQELLAVAGELEKGGDPAAAKGRVAAASKSLAISEKAAEKMLEGDAAAAAVRLSMYAYRSVTGKITAERKKAIASKPDLEAAYKAILDKEKAVEAEKEAFYKEKLRAASPDLEQLEKMKDDLAAERAKEDEELKAKRKADAEAKRKPKKK